MKQIQFYKYAIAGLVLLNLALIGFFILSKPLPPQPLHGDFGIQAPRILHLNAEQRKAFRFSADSHHRKMQALSLRQKELLAHYFQQIVDSSQTDNALLLQKAEQLEREKIEITYQHFEEVKSILKPEQLPYFKEFMQAVLDVMSTNSKKNAPPPKDF